MDIATSARVVRPSKKPSGRVFMYHIRVEGTREYNQPLLTEILKFPFVERQSRFIVERDGAASRIAIFSERDFAPNEIEEMAARFNIKVLEFLDR